MDSKPLHDIKTKNGMGEKRNPYIWMWMAKNPRKTFIRHRIVKEQKKNNITKKIWIFHSQMLKTWVMKNIPYSMVRTTLNEMEPFVFGMKMYVCIQKTHIKRLIHTNTRTRTPPPFFTKRKIKENIEKSFSAAREEKKLCVLYFFLWP